MRFLRVDSFINIPATPFVKRRPGRQSGGGLNVEHCLLIIDSRPGCPTSQGTLGNIGLTAVSGR